MTLGTSTREVFALEAREILDALQEGLLAIDRGEPMGPRIAELFRGAHTLKGGARVVREPAIAEMAHMMEDVLAVHRDSGEPLSAQEMDELLRLVDALAAEVGALGKEAAPAEGDAPAAGPVRVDPSGLDDLVAEIVGMEAEVSGLRAQLANDLGRVPPRAVARLDALEQAIRRARAETDILRLTPASEVFPPLERAARDAAREIGLRVSLSTEGGDVRLDRQVLAAAREGLLHVVRNAVMHGIEPAEERVAAGKPQEGRLRVVAERRGDRIAFVCTDDGRGVDVAAVRRAAVARGLVEQSAADALDDRAALDLIFAPGLTTARAVTELAGRGVGLDAVRSAAARFHGRVTVESTPGRGVAVTIDLPVSLALFGAVSIEARGAHALLPVDAVASVRRLSDADLLRSPSGLSLRHEGALLPFVPLPALLGSRRAQKAGATRWLGVVVRSAAGEVALGADEIGAVREVAMRPLPPAAGRWPMIAGAAIEEGVPALVLDPEGLVRAARTSAAAAHGATPPAKKRLPILVVDDSITTRMLEQTMLEGAGYEVDLACSAEEGLEKAALRPHSLFIADIEMPGMNGFEFAEKTRADAALRDTPVILLSSLSSAADRERGARAGASAYLVKGEFDQRVFLARVEELSR